MINVAYIICALNLLAMIFDVGEIGKEYYFLVGNL